MHGLVQGKGGGGAVVIIEARSSPEQRQCKGNVLSHALKQGSAAHDGFEPGADTMYYLVGL